jgi:hypothetical protein
VLGKAKVREEMRERGSRSERGRVFVHKRGVRTERSERGEEDEKRMRGG